MTPSVLDTIRISVVIATRERTASVVRLLTQLDDQTVHHGTFEAIVVDDGSPEPAGPALDGLALRYAMRHQRIEWSGQAAARHAGVLAARGEILVFVDDDMQVPADFLAAHLARHQQLRRAVVLGRIESIPTLGAMPPFERFNARQLERARASFLAGRTRPQGLHLCTGNVSMRREDYHRAGGFNQTLRRSEDRELGIRLEKDGCTVVYADEARTVHCSDHDDAVWLVRAYRYGQFDHRIAAMHPDVPAAHPWRFWSLIHPASRPVVGVSLVWPALGRLLARGAYHAARLADRMRLPRLAVLLAAVAYATDYFRGLREACGTFGAFWRSRPGANQGTLAELRALARDVRADHDALRAHRLKYQEDVVPASRLLPDLVRRIGFQMLAWYRLMRCLDRCRVPLAPQVLSRLIRHLYGADIHWRTRIEPGVSIVHGQGLVLGRDAVIGTGCILFQHVTIGESLDPATGRVGTPRLGSHVHVAPGATLLGPITVGARSKVGPGAVLTRSVPDSSLVSAAQPSVTTRRPATRVFAKRAV